MVLNPIKMAALHSQVKKRRKGASPVACGAVHSLGGEKAFAVEQETIRLTPVLPEVRVQDKDPKCMLRKYLCFLKLGPHSLKCPKVRILRTQDRFIHRKHEKFYDREICERNESYTWSLNEGWGHSSWPWFERDDLEAPILLSGF